MAKKPKAPTVFSDMGSKHAEGIGKDAKLEERRKKAGEKHLKGPTFFSDMGQKDAVGVGEGK
ncbi:MAG TPA: hypothetical protein VHA78_01365 [Candidatus Peribacteraceae bacterium]|nr:hypothetical protein [Candidatus Peribacteraceae bacterium]